ncbi:FliM/FliN family flagellar motor switch protein [Paracoccus pacificus]|uniref:FliM/FliN family flagellar motor switch protein n=1 Tax=Paracoccus pacificus TaxID=1463598 RepID=A0ABW4RBU5_9RHOB
MTVAIERSQTLVAMDAIPVEVTVRLGRATMTVAELAALRPDDVLGLDQAISDGVDICVGDRVIARGELAAGDDGRVCVRVTGGTAAS